MPTPDKNDEKNAEANPKGERELNVEDVEAEGEDVKGGGLGYKGGGLGPGGLIDTSYSDPAMAI